MLAALKDGGAAAGPMPTYMPPVAAPTSPGPAGHEQPSGGLLPPSTGFAPLPAGTSGFAGTPAQGTTAATIAGLTPNSPQWVAAVSAANANGGVLPQQGSSNPSSPFDSDPGYQAANAAEQLGVPSINNSLHNLIAQRIVAYGDPSLAGMAGFGMDPQAAAFARQNYLSGNGQLARLDKAHTQARQAVINALAAHGLIFSGDTGYQLGNADQSYGNQVYDAQQQALADILGYRNSAQDQITALENAKTAALENAYVTDMNNPAAAGLVTTQPQTVTPKTTVKAPTLPKPKPVVAKPKPNQAAMAALTAQQRAFDRFHFR